MTIALSSLRVAADLDARGWTSGAEQINAANRSMVASTDALGRSQDNVIKFSAQHGRALQSTIGGLDANYKAVAQLERAHRTLTNAQERGRISAEEHARLVGMAVNRFNQQRIANDNLSRTAGLAAHQVQNLGYQLNDIATGLASGQSPFMVLAQQGGQVYQILSSSPGGVGGAVKDLAGRLVTFLGPVGLVAAGLTAAGAAGYAFYAAVKEPAKTAEEILAEHARLVGIVGTAYKDAADRAGTFFAQGRETTILQMMQNVMRLRTEVEKMAGEALSRITLPTSLGSPEMGIAQDINAITARSQYAAFAAAIERLRTSISTGTPDFRTFNEEVARLGVASPALGATAARLIEIAKGGDEMAQKLNVAEASIRYMQGTATEADKALLNLAGTIKAVQQAAEPDALKEFGSALDRLRQLGGKVFEGEKLARDLAAAKDEFNKGLLAIGRDTDPESYAARLKVLENTYRRAVAGIHEADKQGVVSLDAYRTATQRTREEIRLLAEGHGRSSEEMIRLRKETELLKAAEQSKKKDGPELRAEIAAIADEYSRVTIAARDAAQMQSAFTGLGQSLFRAFTSGGDAIEAATKALAGFGSQLASQNISRFLSGGSLLGNNNLMSSQGLAGMLGAGAMGYSSGSALSGALGGAVAGASFGLPGMAIGGVAGPRAGLFASNAKRRVEPRDEQPATPKQQDESSDSDQYRLPAAA